MYVRIHGICLCLTLAVFLSLGSWMGKDPCSLGGWLNLPSAQYLWGLRRMLFCCFLSLENSHSWRWALQPAGKEVWSTREGGCPLFREIQGCLENHDPFPPQAEVSPEGKVRAVPASRGGLSPSHLDPSQKFTPMFWHSHVTNHGQVSPEKPEAHQGGRVSTFMHSFVRSSNKGHWGPTRARHLLDHGK